MAVKLTEDMNVVANSNLEITYFDGDLNIIQKLDDEPNDVGGLSADQLKAEFDKAGNIIKKFINESLIPELLAEDATEQARSEAEQARKEAESGRVAAENKRVAAEIARSVWEDYSGAKSYIPGNKVFYQGSSYINTAACAGILPTDKHYWQLIARKGADADGAVKVNGAEQDENGNIILTGADLPVSGTDATSVASALYNKAPRGGGVMEVAYHINVAKPQSYEDLYTKFDAVLSEMPNTSVRFISIMTNLEPISNTGARMCAIYKADTNYASVYSIGSYDMTSGIYRFIKIGGVWSPVEWLCPRMNIGVEYRTTERYNGKPVYTKLVNLGALPDNSTKIVDAVPNGNGPKIFQMYGLQTYSSVPTSAYWGNQIQKVLLQGVNGQIYITTTMASSTFPGDVIIAIKYWRTTD